MTARPPGTASTRLTRAESVTGRGLIVVSAVLVTLLVLVTPAWAYWSSTGPGTGTGTTGTLAAPTGVSVPANSLPGVAVTWTASTGSPAPTGYYVTRTSGATTTAACGSSAGSLLAGTSCTDSGFPDGAYTYKVIAGYRSWTATSAPSGSVSVWTPTKVVISGQPTNTVAGVAITPGVAVTVETAAGAVVPVAGISVSMAVGTNPAAGTLSGTLTHPTNASGVATFANVSLDKAGAGYTLAATSAGLTGATSSTFTITPAAATTLVITSTAVSGTASAGATLGPITVAERDAFGNVALAPAGGTAVALSSNSTGIHIFATSSGGGAVSSVTIPSGAAGVAFYYGDEKAGTPTITAGGALTGATQSETITAGAAAMLAFGQQPTNTAQGVTITPPVTVQIQDQYGNLTTSAADVSIAIAHNAGVVVLGIPLGTLHGTTPQAAAAGTATFNNLSITGALSLPLGGIGNGYTLQVTSGTLIAATSSPFNIT